MKPLHLVLYLSGLTFMILASWMVSDHLIRWLVPQTLIVID